MSRIAGTLGLWLSNSKTNDTLLLSALTSFIDNIINYKLPLKENFDRRLIVFKKIGKTSPIYPRTYGIMKKSPL